MPYLSTRWSSGQVSISSQTFRMASRRPLRLIQVGVHSKTSKKNRSDWLFLSYTSITRLLTYASVCCASGFSFGTKNSSIIDDFLGGEVCLVDFAPHINNPIAHIRFSMLRIGFFVWHKIPSPIYDFWVGYSFPQKSRVSKTIPGFLFGVASTFSVAEQCTELSSPPSRCLRAGRCRGSSGYGDLHRCCRRKYSSK